MADNEAWRRERVEQIFGGDPAPWFIREVRDTRRADAKVGSELDPDLSREIGDVLPMTPPLIPQIEPATLQHVGSPDLDVTDSAENVYRLPEFGAVEAMRPARRGRWSVVTITVIILAAIVGWVAHEIHAPATQPVAAVVAPSPIVTHPLAAPALAPVVARPKIQPVAEPAVQAVPTRHRTAIAGKPAKASRAPTHSDRSMAKAVRAVPTIAKPKRLPKAKTPLRPRPDMASTAAVKSRRSSVVHPSTPTVPLEAAPVTFDAAPASSTATDQPRRSTLPICRGFQVFRPTTPCRAPR